jgi:hypothetical protein
MDPLERKVWEPVGAGSITSDNALDVLAVFAMSPEYAAVTECVPTASALVV